MLDMPAAAIAWDVSTVSDSGVASVNSRAGLFSASSALDTLLTTEVSRRNCTPRVACRITLPSGPQAAPKTFPTGPMDNLWLASHRDMERERCEGHSRAGLFGTVLADDCLLSIKAPVRICTASVACRISVTDGPQSALKTSVSGQVCNLRLAAHGEEGRERCKWDSPTCLFGGVLGRGLPAHHQGTTEGYSQRGPRLWDRSAAKCTGGCA
ncbi:hypothetical protein MTO96_012821 [Rhipicephalus appendiculatus]